MINSSVKRPRSDAPTVALHWLLVLTLVFSLVTGLRIMADAPDSTITRTLNPILMQGAVTDWHVISAFGLTLLAIAYVVFLWRARLAARVALNLRSIAAADRTSRWTIINRVLYWVAFALVVAAAITGGLLYYFPRLLPTKTVVTIHDVAAWAIIGFVALHVVAELALGGIRHLLKIITPRAAYGGAALLALGASVATVGAVVYPSSEAMIKPLKFGVTDVAPVIDGNPDDAAWRQAKPVEIHTNQGANLTGGEVTVRVRGLRDQEYAYLLFEWRDPTRSQKRLPLVKTAEGWQVMEHNYDTYDDSNYAEDKFAVMLSRSAKVAGGTIHMGHKPLDGKPKPLHGRGYHYTTDGGIVDVWQWKSLRTGPLGQVDDEHFGPPPPAKAGGGRYKAGYIHDPKSAGGFDQNFKKIKGTKFVEPERLPKDLAALQAKMGNVNLDPNVGDEGELWMALSETVPYSKELDTYPAGTVIPSVLIDKPFEGDRGDVAGRGTWKDGWWRLETKRKLDTGSKFDLPIANGVYLWVAAFDHTQNRHTRHVHPVRIALEK